MSINRHLPFIEEKIEGLNMAEKAIMLKLARFCGGNGRGQMDASQETVSKWLGCSTRTVQRAINKLVGYGVVDRKRGFSAPSTIQFSPLYWEHFRANRPLVLVDYSDDKLSHRIRQNGGNICDKLAGTIRQFGVLPERTDPFDYQILTDCNYKKGFPSLHYASVNLVALPEGFPVCDVFPSGGVA
jgi:hypothetical protein